MKPPFLIITLCFFYIVSFSQKSSHLIKPVKFFENDSVLNVTLSFDFNKLQRSRTKPAYQPADFTGTIADSTFTEQTRIIARGNTRRSMCTMPPVKMNFHNKTSPTLYPLDNLKLVYPCRQNDAYDQLLLREYLVYKMYNLLTDKSFRVRLLNMNYTDVSGDKKKYFSHAFFIEDAKALAKRNGCEELKNVKIPGESTNREQMTIVAIFQFMIGNTDFGVSSNHNITLVQTAKTPTALPFVIPYDFDFSGLVDADYAVPSEGLEIENVRQRLYRGYQRTLPELNVAIEIFNNQKKNIYSLINNFQLLTEKNRKDMIGYLDEFYKIINNNSQVQYFFVDQAK